MPTRIGLTLEANYAAAVGDPVMVGPGDFQCVKADGSKPIVGHVTKRNVGRGTLAGGNAGMYPVSVVPGDVTVDAYGHGVKDFPSTGAFAVGIAVGIGSDSKLAAVGAGVTKIGIALQASTGANQQIDVLLQP